MKRLHTDSGKKMSLVKTLFNSLRRTACILAFVLVGATVAMADDTEIYIGGAEMASGVKPNLVFIIDTSGSMDTDVTVSASSYDPGTTYTGSCNASHVYWSTSGTPPSCGTGNYFNASANTCAASSAALSAGGTGFFVTRAARYRARRGEDRWDTLNSSSHTDQVECQDDWGVHGETTASANKYPADENDGGPWRANTSNAINWSNTGSTYTFYSANYLNWRNGASSTITKTRLEIVKEVFADLMDSISNVNIAVMRFDSRSASYNKGGYFVMPMATLSDANRADYKAAVNGFTASGYTPLSETLYEAYQYYRGETIKFGNSTQPGTNVAGVKDPSNSSKYKTPIEYQCQKNFVILLTDGEPTYDTDADADIRALAGFPTVTGSASCSGNCLDELADYMYQKDCSTLDDTQNVITYTIGFATDQTLLSNAATKGGGKYYTADDTAGLTDVFTSILTEILAINDTFTAPSITVNAFNRFSHRDELYYALFRPNSRPKWHGNIKRFKLDGNPPIIVDANGNAAIDANTGFFKSTAKSFWTPAADSPDGDNVKKGGAASKLALPRTLYTYTGSTAPNNTLLTAATNTLSETNTSITKEMLGDAAMSDADRTAILQWARGVDLFDDDADGDTTDIRRLIGDPLHAKPVLITYGGNDANPDITLFVGTNEGFLHAINASDGSETFGFIPQELLPNLPILFEDAAGTAHPYGLDGPLTAWVNDLNNNRILYNSAGSLEAGEFAYLYQGMRRGGRNYYAFDVTSRSAPKLKWIIKGDSGDFSELGQSWSTMVKAKIKLNGTSKDVLIFGGGYDEDQDDNVTAQDDDEGRAVYIVDASTGAKLWQAGPAGTGNAAGGNPSLVVSTMTNSIPSNVTVIDMNRDGYHDRLYVGDMRGQIFRFDIDNENNTSAANLATGGRIAQLGGATAALNRRFYAAPDVSMSPDKKHLNIAIGSGYRAHPLDKDIHDAFFVLHDEYIYSPELNGSGNPVYTTITLSNLFDTTDNTIGQGSAAEISVATESLANSKGYYIYLNEMDGSFVGEKVLAKSTTFAGKLVFSTYTPVASASGACSPSQGTARYYYINVTDGTPVLDLNQSGGGLTREDRRKDLLRGGLPPEASVIFTGGDPTAATPIAGESLMLIGTENIGHGLVDRTPEKIYWHVD